HPARLPADHRRRAQAARGVGKIRQMTAAEDATTGVPRLRRGSLRSDRIVFSTIAILAVVMVGYPVVLVFLRGISVDDVGGPLTAEWLLALADSGRSREALINTAIYTAGSSALAMVVGVGLSFLSARTD